MEIAPRLAVAGKYNEAASIINTLLRGCWIIYVVICAALDKREGIAAKIDIIQIAYFVKNIAVSAVFPITDKYIYLPIVNIDQKLRAGWAAGTAAKNCMYFPIVFIEWIKIARTANHNDCRTATTFYRSIYAASVIAGKGFDIDVVI